MGKEGNEKIVYIHLGIWTVWPTGNDWAAMDCRWQPLRIWELECWKQWTIYLPSVEPVKEGYWHGLDIVVQHQDVTVVARATRLAHEDWDHVRLWMNSVFWDGELSTSIACNHNWAPLKRRVSMHRWAGQQVLRAIHYTTAWLESFASVRVLMKTLSSENLSMAANHTTSK